MISHAEEVEAIFGYWPEFADAKILLLTYERPDSVRLDISYIDADQQKSAIVGLRFTGVEDLDLADLRTENVLDILRILPACQCVLNWKRATA
ncbi:hypothetical protein XAP3CFBP6996_000175 [Xanthomonas citri pv. fuscans CFBP 6996]|uniref:Imm50 family immunity protein n=1 Tax=Xanthomonas citri TaxID=346 RepID=UPI000C19E6D3|nr:Imm50 family immunity protein [Xanthomonas citri]ATS49872.1 hypothetical protein XcfCFBP6992P_02260 [Xanthomonas citri pv. phaseoli var. fuscans]ATS55604.1 hypothetical protein XcfCFBP6994P_10990 [Xanthomonas citri pv. phaseoli var. fuscans]ATS60381.1 hypothetical protein XcfCFBP6996P_14750 [Xanthomonas citri pv. phaseoli var. fuscans]PTY30559.1 hypothetical protein XAP3CFBP6996_000175 [Xanthomonas citri pv. fuscans CFBP 6996]QWN14495.1 hypothetical protein DGN02_00180 [Xanthomonas citri]